MARLIDTQGHPISLKGHHLIGRSRAMTTSLRSPDVSAQHLAIAWDGQTWTVRDLASRNGTCVDGRRLEAGEARPLRRGAVLEIGSPVERWTLVDDAPPGPQASSGSSVIDGQPDLLALPSSDDPLALVIYDPEEGWQLSKDDLVAPIRDGQEIEVGGRRWTISLPEAMDRTIEAARQRAGSPGVAMRFRVSADEEYVELTVEQGGARHRLPARAHHYLLLTLARARLGDSGPSEPERGWLYTEELAKMLRQTSNQIYVNLHRARKEIEALGLPEGGELVERRPTTRQIRLGAREITVEPL